MHALLAETGAAATLPHVAWIWPFVAILLAIALLPLSKRTEHWWHSNRNKLLVSLALSAATLVYYAVLHGGPQNIGAAGRAVWHVLRHSLLDEYVPFITLLFSLYVIAGGILVRGDIRATPLVNTTILAIGGLAASFVGTTGASMVLIRPLLTTNSERKHVAHTVVFFIFIVSNAGGMLLPIGDPPLFLGYLYGVPFTWTLSLTAPWAFVLVALLVVYYFWDRRAYRTESLADLARDVGQIQPLRFAGLINLLWLAGVVAAVALLDAHKPLPGTSWTPPPYLREAVQLGFVGLSLLTTPAGLRRTNEFNYVAIGEVAALFIGIFITMQVPIELLRASGPTFAAAGFTHPWQFFWASGLLSSVLDNAPTYGVFFQTAAALSDHDAPGVLPLASGLHIREDLLRAISCGAVFMGAVSYIGNGPNFMVKSIAERAGVRMPSFFGFMLLSCVILLPLFVVVTLLFFR